MLYGFCPYEESSISKLIGLIDNTILKFPAEVPVSTNTKNLLKKMMMTKYRQRMSSVELLSYPLDVKDIPLSPGIMPQNSLGLKEVISFNRKSMTYLVETLDFLANRI